VLISYGNGGTAAASLASISGSGGGRIAGADCLTDLVELGLLAAGCAAAAVAVTAAGGLVFGFTAGRLASGVQQGLSSSAMPRAP
jgi:hypothetical protein